MYRYKIQNIKNGHEANVLHTEIFIEFLTLPKENLETSEYVVE